MVCVSVCSLEKALILWVSPSLSTMLPCLGHRDRPRNLGNAREAQSRGRVAVEGPTASAREHAREAQRLVDLPEEFLGAVLSPEALRRVGTNSLRGHAGHDTHSPTTRTDGQAQAA